VFFQDLVQQPDEWKAYEQLLGNLSQFLGECIRLLLVEAHRLVEANAATDGKHHHGTVLMLVRHLIEAIDGVSILASKGSAENCGPLMRSAFEAQIEIDYILQSDSERRGLAYQVGYAHRKIKMYRRYDRNDQSGQQFRQRLQGDSFADVFDRIPYNLGAMVKNLEQMLQRPEFAPIETEWQRLQTQRKGKDPEWYSLFNGPSSIEQMAYALKMGTLYEGLYRYWSDFVHPGGTLTNAAMTKEGISVIRPIRHPDGLENVCTTATGMCLHTSRSLVRAYSPAELPRLQRTYVENLQSRYQELLRGNLIVAPWK
jgi:hypothetical protein